MLNTIFFDVDNVLIDYTDAFMRFCNRPDIKPTSYDFMDTGIFSDKDSLDTAMYNFARSQQFVDAKSLALMTDLEALVNVGYKLIALTAMEGDVTMKSNRVRSLTRRFGGVFSGVVFTDGVPKGELLKAWCQETGDEYPILLDDAPHELNSVNPEEVVVCKINYKYNKDVITHQQYDTVQEFTQAMIEASIQAGN